MITYAGIGPRAASRKELEIATSIAQNVPKSWLLRSGHGDGMDQAFARGSGNIEIYLPWSGYNDKTVHDIGYGVAPYSPESVEQAKRAYNAINKANIHAGVEPDWDQLCRGMSAIMLRNVHIILGYDLTAPVKFVITSVDPTYVGGTTHALCIAASAGIPILNYHDPKEYSAIAAYIETLAAKHP